MSSIDPSAMATQLATAYTQNLRNLLNTQSTKAQTTSSALAKLKSALTTFDGALLGLAGKKGVLANSASFSATGYASASASASAQAGTYNLFVEQVATVSQRQFSDFANPTVAVASGTLTVDSGGKSFNVTLDSSVDTDGDGSISASELARAINSASGNAGLVNASVVTTSSGGVASTELILTSGTTGQSSEITLGGSSAAALGSSTQTIGNNAKVWLGAQNSGVLMEQASNTFTNISGVSLTVTKAQATGETPLTLTVGKDSSATAANLQSFIDAYNTLVGELDKLTASGESGRGAAAGAFVSDAGVRALRSRLSSIVRQQSGTLSLASYGIAIDRYGKMSLDQGRMKSGLEKNPDGLDALLGSTASGSSTGILGALDNYLKNWTNGASGQIAKRQSSVETLQKSISARQTRLEDSYQSAYQRYLKQFSALQQLQAQMSDTGSMFSNLSFGSPGS